MWPVQTDRHSDTELYSSENLQSRSRVLPEVRKHTHAFKVKVVLFSLRQYTAPAAFLFHSNETERYNVGKFCVDWEQVPLLFSVCQHTTLDLLLQFCVALTSRHTSANLGFNSMLWNQLPFIFTFTTSHRPCVWHNTIKIKISRATILPVVLYNHCIWSEENWLRMFENRMLKKTFGTKTEKLIWIWENYIMRGFIICTPN
jgi:hypothetical protein